MNSNKKQTLFSLANRLYRDGNAKDACLIYELLSEISPDFKWYLNNEGMVKLSNGINLEKKFHSIKSSNFQRRLRVANIVGDFKLPHLIDECFQDCSLKTPEFYIAIANSLLGLDHEEWLKSLNKYLSFYELDSLNFSDKELIDTKNYFLKLKSLNLSENFGPLVTVCMSCYNAERYVEHAVRSILRQTYKNIELILFNDKSTDNTLSILKKLEKEDDRIKLFDNPVNQGTYISRNHAFQIAQGEFFTILDADDYALPQRIARQVQHLECNPNHIGVITEWIRVFIDGKVQFKDWQGGGYQHEAIATLMVRTKHCKKKAGYWDSVRFAADTEYKYRLQKIFGIENLPLLNLPTVLSLSHDESLTNDPVTGINTVKKGLSPTRIAYRKAWRDWHDSTINSELHIDFPLVERPFKAPDSMLLKKSID